MSEKVTKEFADIKYYGDGPALLVGKMIGARKQIAKKDIYQIQHHDGSSMGYKYKVPESVHKNTRKQKQTRQRLRAAMLAWNRVPEHEQDDWKHAAKGMTCMGHNLFARWWLDNHGFGVAAFGNTAFGDSAGSSS